MLGTMAGLAIAVFALVSFSLATTNVLQRSLGALHQGRASQRINAVLNRSLDALRDSAPLGGCALYNSSDSGCLQATLVGSVLQTASSDGVCWYSYPGDSPVGQSASQLVPPSLECLDWSPTVESLWYLTYAPSASATFFRCAPSSCFVSGAPQPGALPAISAVSGSAAGAPEGCGQGCSAQLVAAHVQPQSGQSGIFSYAPGSDPRQVTMAFSVRSGAGGQFRVALYTRTVPLVGAVQEGDREWNSVP